MHEIEIDFKKSQREIAGKITREMRFYITSLTLLAHAIACLVDSQGRILVDALRPASLPEPVRAALSDVSVGQGPGDPVIDPNWGEPGLTSEEKIFGWNTLEVLAFKTGTPEAPVNAIPPAAKATMQLRFVVGTDVDGILPAVQARLDAHGLRRVTAKPARMETFAATRLDPLCRESTAIFDALEGH